MGIHKLASGSWILNSDLLLQKFNNLLLTTVINVSPFVGFTGLPRRELGSLVISPSTCICLFNQLSCLQDLLQRCYVSLESLPVHLASQVARMVSLSLHPNSFASVTLSPLSTLFYITCVFLLHLNAGMWSIVLSCICQSVDNNYQSSVISCMSFQQKCEVFLSWMTFLQSVETKVFWRSAVSTGEWAPVKVWWWENAATSHWEMRMLVPLTEKSFFCHLNSTRYFQWWSMYDSKLKIQQMEI